MGFSHGSSLSDFRSVLSQPTLLLRGIVRIKYKDQVLYILEFLKKKWNINQTNNDDSDLNAILTDKFFKSN